MQIEDLQQMIENYVEQHTDDVSDLLENLILETQAKTGLARWSIGKLEGKLIQFLIKISDARNVVEVGTFTGYSALLIAEALPPDGVITTCESHSEYAEIARRYFQMSPFGGRIKLVSGPALATLRTLPDRSVDFFFIDADKPSYGNYFDEAMRLLKSGGVVFVDNVFWRGKIFKATITNENAKAIAAFNEKVRREKRVERLMLPVRDGVYLIRKK